MRGVVAAGHPVTAGAGAEILRAGGNAVDAALAAMFTSFVAEPMLTGLGAGGYMLVAPPGSPPVLLDFFVEAPGRGLEPGAKHAPLLAVDVDFGDAVQVFNIGASAAGPYGTPSGAWAAAQRFARLPPARARRARRGGRPRRRRGQRAPGVPVRDPLADHRLHAGGARAVHAGGALAAGRRRAPPPRAGRRARAARRRRAGAVLHRRHRRGRVRLGGRARRHADARRPRRLRDRRARARPRRLPRPDGADQPAAERGRHPARVRARPARACAGAALGRRDRRRDGVRPGRAHAGVPRRPLGPRLPRALQREPAGSDDAHLGGGRRRLGLRGDLHERRGLRRGRAGHRHPPQQHDGRAGPLAVRLSTPTHRDGGCRR